MSDIYTKQLYRKPNKLESEIHVYLLVPKIEGCNWCVRLKHVDWPGITFISKTSYPQTGCAEEEKKKKLFGQCHTYTQKYRLR